MVTMIFRYKCHTCSEIHVGFPAVAFAAPSYYDDIPESEREARCKLSPDTCIVDDQYYFVRCVLEYPIIGTSEKFSWGIWGSLSKASYEQFMECYDLADRSGYGPFFSYFSNRLPRGEYPETENLICNVQPQDGKSRPVLFLKPTDHPLSVEEREGITLAKAVRLIQPIVSWHSLESGRN